MKKILVTGAGTGFGKLFSFELVKRGYSVVAAVELPHQITLLRQESMQKNLPLEIIKVNICDELDRKYAISKNADIIVNNAGIGEGGALIDMPEHILRRQFEVNFFATTQIAKEFAGALIANKKPGRIIFISSLAGLITPDMTGAYCASKHALEAVAESFKSELAHFNISVSTINPGPYQTGFNDQIMEAAQSWQSMKENHIDHSNLKFELPQYDAEQDIVGMCDVIVDDRSKFRNVFPNELVEMIKSQQSEAWNK